MAVKRPLCSNRPVHVSFKLFAHGHKLGFARPQNRDAAMLVRNQHAPIALLIHRLGRSELFVRQQHDADRFAIDFDHQVRHHAATERAKTGVHIRQRRRPPRCKTALTRIASALP